MKKILAIIILSFAMPLSSFSQEKQKEKEKRSFAFIPIISYNSSFKTQFGLLANFYYDVNKKDTVSPASTLGLYATYYTNKTYFAGLFAKNHFKNDKYRTTVAIGNGSIKFQTYVSFDMPSAPVILESVNPIEEDGSFVAYDTKLTFIYLQGSREIIQNLYLGLRLSYSSVNTIFESDIIPNEKYTSFGFGLDSEYDSRDNIFNPSKGSFIQANSFSFLEKFNPDYEYHILKLMYNHFFPFSDKTTLLARTYAAVSIGDDIPVAGKNLVGRDDLRGYSNGKYRRNQVYDIQSELRWNFYKKWGAVFFGGLAIAQDDIKGKHFSGILPSAGTGLRFKAIPSRNINIGVDVAVGKDDWGLYFRIGEAFGR